MILAYTHVFKPFARPIEITQKKSFQKYHKLVITNALLGNPPEFAKCGSNFRRRGLRFVTCSYGTLNSVY